MFQRLQFQYKPRYYINLHNHTTCFNIVQHERRNEAKRWEGKREGGRLLMATSLPPHTPFKPAPTDKNNIMKHLFYIK
jgi:hypothetical protein